MSFGVKPREYLSAKGVVARFYDALSPVRGEAVAIVCRKLLKKPQRIYGYADDGEKDHMRLEQALLLTQETGVSVFAEAFAAAAGGHFTPGERRAEAARDLLAEVAADNGTLLADGVRGFDSADPKAKAEILEDIEREIADDVALRNKLRSP